MTADPNSLPWIPAPPPFRGRSCRILSPKPGQPVVALLLSSQLEGIIQHHNPHFGNGRTGPCMAHTGYCDGCNAKLRKQWKGFFAAINRADRRLALVEVTPEAVRGTPDLLDKTVDKRGMDIRLIRRGEARNSPVQALLTRSVIPQQLPAAFPVREQLLKIWGLEDYKDA